MWLSDEDETDFAHGISCTNLKTAVNEARQLSDLYSAVRWLKKLKVPPAGP